MGKWKNFSYLMKQGANKVAKLLASILVKPWTSVIKKLSLMYCTRN
jgi:hypothetical protein